uniref:Choline/ethanolamine kinase n=1 Tax=Caenorhabditis japonica TaxID=281687 RepID=A0A8R1EAG6_CAEJA
MTETISAIEKLFTENALTSNAILEKVIELGIDFLAWKDVEKSQVEVTRILGGQSNHMFHITTSLDGPTDFLLRIHRQIPSHVFKDTVNFAIFSERGLGPKLYGFCDGARLEEYLPSKTMTVETILNPEITRKIGAVFPRYHAIEMPFPKSRRCIQVMREWLEEYKRLGGTDYQINARTVSWRDHPATVSVEELSREIDGFEKWAKEIYEHTLVYSHNDLAVGFLCF